MTTHAGEHGPFDGDVPLDHGHERLARRKDPVPVDPLAQPQRLLPGETGDGRVVPGRRGDGAEQERRKAEIPAREARKPRAPTVPARRHRLLTIPIPLSASIINGPPSCFS